MPDETDDPSSDDLSAWSADSARSAPASAGPTMTAPPAQYRFESADDVTDPHPILGEVPADFWSQSRSVPDVSWADQNWAPPETFPEGKLFGDAVAAMGLPRLTRSWTQWPLPIMDAIGQVVQQPAAVSSSAPPAAPGSSQPSVDSSSAPAPPSAPDLSLPEEEDVSSEDETAPDTAQRNLDDAQDAADDSRQQTTAQLRELNVPLIDRYGAPLDLDTTDPATLRDHIHETFDAASRQADATARQLWSFDEPDPTARAQTLRDAIEQRRGQALDAVDGHENAVRRLQFAQDAFDQTQPAREDARAEPLPEPGATYDEAPEPESEPASDELGSPLATDDGAVPLAAHPEVKSADHPIYLQTPADESGVPLQYFDPETGAGYDRQGRMRSVHYDPAQDKLTLSGADEDRVSPEQRRQDQDTLKNAPANYEAANAAVDRQWQQVKDARAGLANGLQKYGVVDGNGAPLDMNNIGRDKIPELQQQVEDYFNRPAAAAPRNDLLSSQKQEVMAAIENYAKAYQGVSEARDHVDEVQGSVAETAARMANELNWERVKQGLAPKPLSEDLQREANRYRQEHPEKVPAAVPAVPRQAENPGGLTSPVRPAIPSQPPAPPQPATPPPPTTPSQPPAPPQPATPQPATPQPATPPPPTAPSQPPAPAQPPQSAQPPQDAPPSAQRAEEQAPPQQFAPPPPPIQRAQPPQPTPPPPFGPPRPFAPPPQDAPPPDAPPPQYVQPPWPRQSTPPSPAISAPPLPSGMFGRFSPLPAGINPEADRYTNYGRSPYPMPPWPEAPDAQDFQNVKWRGEAHLLRDGSVALNLQDLKFAPGSPPSVNLYDRVLVDPQRFAEGVQRARQKGWITPADARQMAAQQAQVQALAAQRQRLVAQAGSNPHLKAILEGTTKGGAELAAGLGVGRVAALPFSETPPVAAGVGLVAGGLASLGAGKLYDAALAKMAKSNSLAASIEASAQLHPAYAQGGELAAMLIPVPGSLAKLAQAAHVVKAARGTAAAAGYLTRQLGTKAFAGVAGDLAVRGTGQMLGIPGTEVTPGSILNAAKWGALSGHDGPGRSAPELSPEGRYIPARTARPGAPTQFHFDPSAEAAQNAGRAPNSYTYGERSAPLAGEDAAAPGSSSREIGAGSSGLPTAKPMSAGDRTTLENAIAAKQAEMAARYSKLGIVPEYNPNDHFAVKLYRSGKITPNLPSDSLLRHALDKSRGDLRAALKIVRNAHEEEYYHTVDSLQMKKDWEKLGRPGNNFAQYSNFKNNLLAQEVVGHVNNLAPEERVQAIRDLADSLRYYDEEKYEDQGDMQIWKDLQSNLGTRNAFADELVRGLAHFSNENTNSETGYLEPLNADKHEGRVNFYRQKLFQTELNEFGPQLRDRVRRVAVGVKAQNPVVP